MCVRVRLCFATYERVLKSTFWTLVSKEAQSHGFPQLANICQQTLVPVRTAKIHTTFREKLLRRIYDVQRILHNMVLFRCYTCNRRFPTFHPEHMPPFNLQCLASCSVEVAFFDSKPKSERSKFASYHTGRCKKCHDDLLKADKDEETKNDFGTPSWVARLQRSK